MKITCLGTGCPEPNPRRGSSGYLAEVGDDVILMDCGGGVYDRLVQSGRKPSDITHLFFTHLHSDHMIDYARLVHAAWDEGGASLKVWGPPPIADITEKLFGRDGVLSHDLRARTENQGSQNVWVDRGGTLPRPWPEPVITEIQPGFAFDGDGWRLSTCQAIHAQPQLECMAFRLEAGDKSMAYSGDAALTDPVEQLVQNVDLLIHWCYRMSGDETFEFIRKLSPDPVEIAQLAQRAGVKKLLATHLRVAMDTYEARQKILKDLQTHFDGESGIAEDLMVVEL